MINDLENVFNQSDQIGIDQVGTGMHQDLEVLELMHRPLEDTDQVLEEEVMDREEILVVTI